MAKKRTTLILMFAFVAVFGFALQGFALNYTIGGRPLEITGFINQSVNFGFQGDSHYETQSQFNSFITDAKIEGKYSPSDEVSMFLSGRFNADWAYQILSSNNEWDKKDFDKSKSRLNVLDDWQDILNEAHVTWARNKFYLRAGKQIVQWGETDGWRLANVINPVDMRRGVADVKFENTIIPVWLLRTEYNTPVESTWLKELGFQFVFDPNFKFRGNEVVDLGNDYMGAWSPKAIVPLGGPYPFDQLYVGSFNYDFDKFNDFEPRGFTYGLKVKGNVMDTTVNLLFYYGRDRDYVALDNNSLTRIDPTNAWDGRSVLHAGQTAYYPYFKFVGATLTRDLSGVKSSFLGGVSPVLRIEALYAFNSSFAIRNGQTSAVTQIQKTDEFQGMVGLDWKVKIPFLNPTAFFTISPQYFYQKVMDYPHGDDRLIQRASIGPFPLETSNHMTSLMVNTSYFHTKVTPTVFWLRHWTRKFDMYKAEVAYAPTSNWTYKLGVLVFDGEQLNYGFETMKNKDQLYFTMGYQF